MKRTLMLVATIAALSAIAIPSMASAATWSPLNTYHNLSSPSSLTFNIQVPGQTWGLTCSSGPTFAGLVRTPASHLMDLTTLATSIPCTGTGELTGYAHSMVFIGLPAWSVDGASTTNVKVNSVKIQGSGFPLGAFTVSGTLVGGVWNSLTRSVAFTNATGLSITSPLLGTYPVTVTSSEFIKDTTSPFLSLL